MNRTGGFSACCCMGILKEIISLYTNALQPKYEFAQENPYRETENALQKGMEKLKEGDLPSAILFFEAAVSL